MKPYGLRRRDRGCKWGCCLGKYGMYHDGHQGGRRVQKKRRLGKRLSHKAERARIRMDIVKCGITV